MSRTITFEGRRIVVPDDATDDEITTILEAPPSRQMPAVASRTVPSLMDRLAGKNDLSAAGGRAQPQPGYGSGQIIEVEAPDGSIVEFPAGTPDDVMSKAMRQAFGGPAQAQQRRPAVPSLMDRLAGHGETAAPVRGRPPTDDLPAGFRVVSQPPAADDIPPGFRIVQPGPTAASPWSSNLDAMARGSAPAATPTATPAPVPTLMDRLAGGASTAMGVGRQAVRGAARGAAGLAGLPVDLVTGAMNVGLRAAGASSIERPVFGSDYNKRTVDMALDADNALTNLLPGVNRPAPSQGPQNVGERVAGRIGEEVGAMALPVGAAVRAGQVMSRPAIENLPAIARMFVEPASINAGRFAWKEGAAATAAGSGAAAANEFTRAAGYKEGSVPQLAGDFVGALGGLGTLGVANTVGPKALDIFNAVRRQPNFVNQVAQDKAVETIADAYGLDVRSGVPVDTSPIVDAISNGRRIGETIPGYRESLADRTGDTGLAGLEYSRQTAGSGQFAQRNRDNIEAVDAAMQALAPNGNPGAFRQAMEARRTGLQQEAATDAASAQARFDEAAARLQSVMHADARGADIRAPLEDALRAAREVEREAWGRVQGEVDPAPLARTFGEITGRQTPSEQRMLGDLRAALDTPAGLVPERPPAPAPAPPAPEAPPTLRQRLEETYFGITGGEAARAVRLKDIRSALGDVPREQVDAELAAILRGDPNARLSQFSDPASLDAADRAARFAPAGEPFDILWLQNRPQSAAPAAPPAPPEAPAGTTPLRNITSLRGELTDAQRVAASQGETQRARMIGQYVEALDGYLGTSAPDPALYDAARGVSRDLNDRFTRPTTAIAQVLDRNQGLPRVPDSGVAGRFVQPDSGKVDDFMRLVRETGNEPRTQAALADELRARLSRARSPDQIDGFVRDHSRVMQQFPEVRAQAGEASASRRAVDTANARREGLDASLGTPTRPGTSSVGRYLRFGDEASKTAMRGVIDGPQPAQAADELLNFAGNSPEAVQGARRTAWDIIEERARSRGETTATADGTQPWLGARLKRTLDDPRFSAVLQRLYRDDPEHLDNLRKIADELKYVNTRSRARAPGSSGTAQGMSQVLSPETLQSRFYAYKRGQISGQFLATSIGAVFARRRVADAEKNAIARLVDEALTNPEIAKVLLTENNPRNRAILGRVAKGWIGNEAGTVVQLLDREDEDPTMGALRRATEAAARQGASSRLQGRQQAEGLGR